MGVSAGIVVTGTEVLTGRVADQNGPWLAEQLRRLGLDVGQIVVVGDRPDDVRSALRFLAASNELVITSGGLGPTADDLTAEVVAEVQGRAPRLDPDLERRIAEIVQRLAARFGGLRDPESTAIATRKQATVPTGAIVIEPAGTAPGLVVPVAPGRTGPAVIVLPGPPRELQQMWPAVVRSAPVQAVLAGARELRQSTVRLWGVPESELATTLRRADGDLDGLEITTCLSAGELEIVSRYAPEADQAQQRLVAAVRADFPAQLFSEGATVDELVATGLRARSWTAAVAEAATGGALSTRLVGAPLLGGVTVVAGGSLTGLLGVPAELLRGFGVSSPEVARLMAEGARAAFGAEVGLGVTEVGSLPDGSGRVHLSVVTPDGEVARTLAVTGTAAAIRGRVVPVALHLLRQVLAAGA